MTPLDTVLTQRVRWTETLLAIDLTTGAVSTPFRYSATKASQMHPADFQSFGTSVGRDIWTTQPIASMPNSPSPWTVNALRDFSGLTAAQLGRLFGVSRRSINNWMAGNSMAEHHEQRLSALQAFLITIPATTSEERRLALLDSSKGPSLFQQLVDEIPEGPVLHVNPLAVRDQF